MHLFIEPLTLWESMKYPVWFRVVWYAFYAQRSKNWEKFSVIYFFKYTVCSVQPFSSWMTHMWWGTVQWILQWKLKQHIGSKQFNFYSSFLLLQWYDIRSRNIRRSREQKIDLRHWKTPSYSSYRLNFSFSNQNLFGLKEGLTKLSTLKKHWQGKYLHQINLFTS